MISRPWFLAIPAPSKPQLRNEAQLLAHDRSYFSVIQVPAGQSGDGGWFAWLFSVTTSIYMTMICLPITPSELPHMSKQTTVTSASHSPTYFIPQFLSTVPPAVNAAPVSWRRLCPLPWAISHSFFKLPLFPWHDNSSTSQGGWEIPVPIQFRF